MRHLTSFLFLGTLACTSPDGELLPTRKWRAAVARAALRSIRSNADDDPRIDYGWALIELLGDEVPPPRIAEMIDALMAIEHPVETPTTIHPM